MEYLMVTAITAISSLGNTIVDPPPSPAPVIIMNDESDDYRAYAAAVSRLKTEKRSIVINGVCSAACTMALELPFVCVGKGAVLRWKSIQKRATGYADQEETERMLKRLPPTVYSRLYGTVKMTYTPEATLYHDDLIKLGISDCPATEVANIGKNDKVILTPPPGTGPIVITNDGGGFVVQYAAAIDRIAYSGRRVEVRGSCRSACTMVLELPNVCIDRRAVFKWHQAYDKYTGIKDITTTEWMLSRLPVKIQARLKGVLTQNYTEKTTLYYDDIRQLGVPDCDATPPVPLFYKSQGIYKKH